MREFKYTVKDELGMHARPAGLFVKEAVVFPGRITIVKNGKEADGKKIFAVMELDVKCGDEIILRTEGEQEEEAISVLSRFLEENL